MARLKLEKGIIEISGLNWYILYLGSQAYLAKRIDGKYCVSSHEAYAGIVVSELHNECPNDIDFRTWYDTHVVLLSNSQMNHLLEASLNASVA